MTAALWDGAALRAATGGRLDGDVAVTGIAIDSRGIAPGALFVALRAAQDGHAYVGAALAAGAAAAMVDTDIPGAGPLLRVDDTLAGLHALGAAGRARTQARVAAITGSVGKTGTKDMLALLLGALGATHAAHASYNNHWGVPLTLARLPADADFAVLEIGMNIPGEIAPLARLARAEVAAITTIGAAHVGHLGSVAAIAAEKAAILEGAAVAVLPADSPHLPLLAARATGRVVTFGRAAGATLRLLDVTADADGTRAHIAWAGGEVRVAMPAIGVHHAENACCALAVVHALGLDVVAAAPALAGYAPGHGRGAARAIAVAGGAALLIDESYNAAPPAMHAALVALALRPATRRIAVLGAMRELGPEAPRLHAALAPDAARADLVFCCGADMAALWEALPPARRGAFTPTSHALAPILRDALRPGDAVLVKGALGTNMAVVVAALTGNAP